jgi:hypothetical protein
MTKFMCLMCWYDKDADQAHVDTIGQDWPFCQSCIAGLEGKCQECHSVGHKMDCSRRGEHPGAELTRRGIDLFEAEKQPGHNHINDGVYGSCPGCGTVPPGPKDAPSDSESQSPDPSLNI